MPRPRAPRRKYNTATTARLLGCTQHTLWRWRRGGAGPKWYVEDGRVWYVAKSVEDERERRGLGPVNGDK